MATITAIDQCKVGHVLMTALMSHKNVVCWTHFYQAAVAMYPTINDLTEKFISDQESAQWSSFNSAVTREVPVIHGVCYRHLTDGYPNSVKSWFKSSVVGEAY